MTFSNREREKERERSEVKLKKRTQHVLRCTRNHNSGKNFISATFTMDFSQYEITDLERGLFDSKRLTYEVREVFTF